MNSTIHIANHIVSKSSPTYVIAEMSANHLQDYGRAVEIVHAAKESGADAIKLQTYTADTITLDCTSSLFQISGGTIWDGTTLHKLYEEAYTPWEWQPKLMDLALSLGLDCFSSPFDFSAVEFMEEMNMPAYKVASYEINDIPLIRKIAQTQKPIILSTGIARLEDIERAIQTCKAEGNENIILLKCVSAYPAPYEDINLNAIPTLSQTFNCLMGLSDHTMGATVAVGAVALGARMIEKHLTLKRSDGGPDGSFSMEPEEFAQMVQEIRIIEKALGDSYYHLTPVQESEHLGSRSLFVVKDIAQGERLTPENIRSIRPGNGLHTMYYEDVLGQIATRPLSKGMPLEWNMFHE